MTDYINVISSELKPGDKVRITVTGEYVGPDLAGYHKFDLTNSPFPYHLAPETVYDAIIQREIPVPPEPAVGDTLRYHGSKVIHTIRAIINGRWITTIGGESHPAVYPPSAFNAYERTPANGPQ